MYINSTDHFNSQQYQAVRHWIIISISNK